MLTNNIIYSNNINNHNHNNTKNTYTNFRNILILISIYIITSNTNQVTSDILPTT